MILVKPRAGGAAALDVAQWRMVRAMLQSCGSPHIAGTPALRSLMRLTRLRILLLWSAICAVLGHALMPAMSLAVNAAAGNEICLEHAHHGAAGQSLPEWAKPQCGYCTAGVFLATPPAPPRLPVVRARGQSARPMAVAGTRSARIREAAPPRGPPSLHC